MKRALLFIIVIIIDLIIFQKLLNLKKEKFLLMSEMTHTSNY
jgi:hypothetical protein